MTTDINDSFDKFVNRWLRYQAQENIHLLLDSDAQWPSPAEDGQPDESGKVRWQPVRQNQNHDLQALVDGLGLQPDKQLESYYTRYYGDNLNARTTRGDLQLLVPWNQDDFIRLQENLIAHVMMKRRLRQAETLFFAVTDEEDFILSVLNDTGEVALEQVGKEPQEILANSLAEFLDTLQPVAYEAQ
ncbi:SecY-interacting protein [Planctobacterium marinum]|uniref:SecY-interacting protein n=1 Tax=Planctobacterium marinum TaxID=1631968 RepID=UPI001E499707|nr:SecY-interacting protein [Planctobacterium marinum]MCC2606077.1 SecY-interacting protein [Planctobacterium marinum]